MKPTGRVLTIQTTEPVVGIELAARKRKLELILRDNKYSHETGYLFLMPSGTFKRSDQRSPWQVLVEPYKLAGVPVPDFPALTKLAPNSKTGQTQATLQTPP